MSCDDENAPESSVSSHLETQHRPTTRAMLGSSSPPLDDVVDVAADVDAAEEGTKANTVSPSPSCHVSRSSTPGLSSLDGTPRWLLPSPNTTDPSVISPASQDMAIKPAQLAHAGHGESCVALEFPDCAPPDDVLAEPESPMETDKAPGMAQTESELLTIPDLPELSHILCLENYQEQRANHSQSYLKDLQISSAKVGRLVAATRSVRRTLAECLRSEDKLSFASLFHAFQDACTEASRLPEPAHHVQLTEGQELPLPPVDFLKQLIPDTRDAVLGFLSRVRYDASFIADRIASLSHKELMALLPDQNLARSSESIFGASRRTNSRGIRPLGYVVDRLLDDVSASAYGSPLEAMVYSMHHGESSKVGNDDVPTIVWAEVCRTLLVARRRDTERIIPSLLDIWTHREAWHGIQRLQSYIIEVLQESQSLPEPNRKTFTVRMQGQPDNTAEDLARTESFYDRAVARLLDLFGDVCGPSVIPPGTIALCQAIWKQLPNPEDQTAFSRFVLTHWMFSTFVPDILVLPESFGMLSSYYIPDTTRHRILKQIAARSYKAVSDVIYSFRMGSVVASQTVERVQKIIGRIRPGNEMPPSTSVRSTVSRKGLVAVSATDTLTLINALHPLQRPASLSSDLETLRSGLHSSASSVSGFSLFRASEPTLPKSPFQSFSIHSDPSTIQTISQNHFEGQSQEQLETSVKDESRSMSEARMELEELVNANRMQDSEYWAALSVSDRDRKLEPLLTSSSRSLFVGGIDAHNSEGSGNGCTSLPSSCMKSVEVLLRRSQQLPSTGLAGETQSENSLDGLRSQILSLFYHAVETSQDASDFIAAHHWHCELEEFNRFSTDDDIAQVAVQLNRLKKGVQGSLMASLETVETCEDILTSLQPSFQRRLGALDLTLDVCRSLRDKMWYTADVRTSGIYEGVRALAGALRVMGKPKRAEQKRAPPPLRHWNTAKTTYQQTHLKSEAQILELLSTVPAHGGPNKLSGEQSSVVSSWLKRNNIALVCGGEERIHKLCMEIRKCVEQLTNTDYTENPFLWSNVLYAREDSRNRGVAKGGPGLSALDRTSRQLNSLTLETSQLRSMNSLENTSHTLSSSSSRDYFDARSPTLTNKSSATFWSPVMTEARSPSSATSIGDYVPMGSYSRKAANTGLINQPLAVDTLRQHVTGFFISDLSVGIFSDGSETDRAFCKGLGWELFVRNQASSRAQPGSPEQDCGDESKKLPQHLRGFDFEHSIGVLFTNFTKEPDPYAKLQYLLKVQQLLVPFMRQRKDAQSCETAGSDQTSGRPALVHTNAHGHSSNTHIAGFYALFEDSKMRPSALFRDLQYIASLVPDSVLENGVEGKAFLNAAAAATRLKRDILKLMVETADSIIAYHTNNRGHGRSSSVAQQQRDSATFSVPSRTASAEDIARYTMMDAAYLLQITAKEGDPTAQRELGTLYLTHPELMDHIVAPFARPQEVFREELESKWRKNQDPSRCDPATMCVAHHWMLLSSKGGDALAAEFLRQREEMERLP